MESFQQHALPFHAGSHDYGTNQTDLYDSTSTKVNLIIRWQLGIGIGKRWGIIRHENGESWNKATSYQAKLMPLGVALPMLPDVYIYTCVWCICKEPCEGSLGRAFLEQWTLLRHVTKENSQCCMVHLCPFCNLYSKFAMYTVHPFWAKSKNINYKENHPQIDKTHALTRLVQTTMLEEIGQWYVQASPFRPNVFRSNIQLTKPPIVTLRPRKLGISKTPKLAVFPGHFHVYIGHSERTCRVEHKDLDATHFQDSSPVMVNNAPRLFFLGVAWSIERISFQDLRQSHAHMGTSYTCNNSRLEL